MPTILTGPGNLRGPVWSRQAGVSPVAQWYGALMVSSSSTAITNDSLYATPYYSGRGGVIDRIGISITAAAAAGKKIRLGIYEPLSDPSDYPGNLVLDSGELAADGIAFVSSVVSVSLQPGVNYWLVASSDGAPSVLRGVVAGPRKSAAGAVISGIGYVTAYGVLPNLFPTAAPVLLSTCPDIVLRYSS